MGELWSISCPQKYASMLGERFSFPLDCFNREGMSPWVFSCVLRGKWTRGTYATTRVLKVIYYGTRCKSCEQDQRGKCLTLLSFLLFHPRSSPISFLSSSHFSLFPETMLFRGRKLKYKTVAFFLSHLIQFQDFCLKSWVPQNRLSSVFTVPILYLHFQTVFRHLEWWFTRIFFFFLHFYCTVQNLENLWILMLISWTSYLPVFV